MMKKYFLKSLRKLSARRILCNKKACAEKSMQAKIFKMKLNNYA